MTTTYRRTQRYFFAQSITIALFLFCILLANPITTHAAALSEAQVESVEILLRSFGVEENTIAAVSRTLSAADASPVTVTSQTDNSIRAASDRPCVTLTNNLYLNRTDAQTNGDVSRLQTYLRENIVLSPGTWADITVNGTFDEATERYVQAYQARTAIVTSGTPETTGYGYVGPRTRDALACDAPTTTNNTPTTTTVPAQEPSLVAYGCTIQGGGACNVSIAYTTRNTAGGSKVDIVVRPTDGSGQGKGYTDRNTMGALIVPISIPGEYTVGIYNAGNGFRTTSLLKSVPVTVRADAVNRNDERSGAEGAGANGGGIGGPNAGAGAGLGDVGAHTL